MIKKTYHNLIEESGATFSDCEKYRYDLWRYWAPYGKLFIVVGLNPSTADHKLNDRTISKCIKFAKREDCSGLVMLNLYAYRSTDPDNLFHQQDPIGPDNDSIIKEWFKFSESGSILVGAWGSHHSIVQSRLNAILKIDTARALRRVRPAHQVMLCFAKNQDGNPKHPLYVKGNTPLIPLLGDQL